MKKINLRFKEWLIDQQNRKDLIGDLARVPSVETIDDQFAKNKPDEHKNWADIVIEITEPGYITVFNDAWQEFLLAKKAAEDSPD